MSKLRPCKDDKDEKGKKMTEKEAKAKRWELRSQRIKAAGHKEVKP